MSPHTAVIFHSLNYDVNIDLSISLESSLLEYNMTFTNWYLLESLARSLHSDIMISVKDSLSQSANSMKCVPLLIF